MVRSLVVKPKDVLKMATKAKPTKQPSQNYQHRHHTNLDSLCISLVVLRAEAALCAFGTIMSKYKKVNSLPIKH